MRNDDALGIMENVSIDEDVIALSTTELKKIYDFLKVGSRTAEHRRTTNETDIFVKINLDGNGKSDIHTG